MQREESTIFVQNQIVRTKKYALGAIRTRDLSLKRGVLYLLSYKRIFYKLYQNNQPAIYT